MKRTIEIPENLHADTTSLVLRFAAALAKKLNKAQKKYGYSNGWMTPKWIQTSSCVDQLATHVQKGDPLDVAAYCAFLWHHKASTQGSGRRAYQVLIFHPELTHSVWTDWGSDDCLSEDEVLDLLRAGVESGEYVGWRVTTLHQEVLGRDAVALARLKDQPAKK